MSKKIKNHTFSRAHLKVIENFDDSMLSDIAYAVLVQDGNIERQLPNIDITIDGESVKDKFIKLGFECASKEFARKHYKSLGVIDRLISGFSPHSALPQFSVFANGFTDQIESKADTIFDGKKARKICDEDALLENYVIDIRNFMTDYRDGSSNTEILVWIVDLLYNIMKSQGIDISKSSESFLVTSIATEIISRNEVDLSRIPYIQLIIGLMSSLFHPRIFANEQEILSYLGKIQYLTIADFERMMSSEGIFNESTLKIFLEMAGYKDLWRYREIDEVISNTEVDESPAIILCREYGVDRFKKWFENGNPLLWMESDSRQLSDSMRLYVSKGVAAEDFETVYIRRLLPASWLDSFYS